METGWFYSSLAQASSSIVGLIGAVLGMHLIEHLALMREERREIIERVDAVYKQISERSQHWVSTAEALRGNESAAAELSHLEEIAGNYPRLNGLVSESEIRSIALRLHEAANRLPPHSKPIHAMAADAAVLEKLASRLGRFRVKLFPRSFSVIMFVLAWLYLTAVVWPLSVLPGVKSYPDGIMLIALGTGVLALLGYFAYLLRVLARLGLIYWTKPR